MNLYYSRGYVDVNSEYLKSNSTENFVLFW